MKHTDEARTYGMYGNLVLTQDPDEQRGPVRNPPVLDFDYTPLDVPAVGMETYDVLGIRARARARELMDKLSEEGEALYAEYGYYKVTQDELHVVAALRRKAEAEKAGVTVAGLQTQRMRQRADCRACR